MKTRKLLMGLVVGGAVLGAGLGVARAQSNPSTTPPPPAAPAPAPGDDGTGEHGGFCDKNGDGQPDSRPNPSQTDFTET